MRAPSVPRPKLTTWRLPALILVLLILQLLLPYAGWKILLMGLGGAWLLAYLWTRSLARGLTLTREMRFGWVQVGDQMLERFTLVNSSWAPALWVEVLDQSTLPDYHASRGTSVASRHSTRWHVEALCTRRGLFTLGPTTVQTGDPFGLYQICLHYPISLPLLVLPPVVPLPAIEIAPGGRAGDGHPRPNAPERTISAAGVRQYLPGDSWRWIHWRTSARRDSLFVRLFDGVPAGDWWILLDMDQYVQVGEGADSTTEHAVILAASLADRGLRARQAVGLLAHGEELVWLPPRQGEGQRWEILRALALLSCGWRSLGDLLAGVQPLLGMHSCLTIITPSVDPAWVEPVLPLMRSGITPTVLLLDPSSFGGPGNPKLLQGLLADLGVTHTIVTRDLLDRPEARPGQRWRWGRPVPAVERGALPHHPFDRAWKALGP